MLMSFTVEEMVMQAMVDPETGDLGSDIGTLSFSKPLTLYSRV
jgi:hypothetical protein